MSKTFLITSHTQGKYPFEQETLLIGLVSSLKKHFPDCFLVIASQSSVPTAAQNIADYILVDKKTFNLPHGYGELCLVKAAIKLMKQFSRPNFFKITYDFIIDEQNVGVFDQWESHGKDFVSCKWETKGSGIGTWTWFGTTNLVEQIFDFDILDNYIECKVLQSIQQKNLLDSCYLYSNHESMFNEDWYSHCDLVHAGGSMLKYNYGTVVAVIELDDENKSTFLARLYSILNQTRDPNHLLIVDSRKNIDDLRNRSYFQEVFRLFESNNISWSVVFGADSNQLLYHLIQLEYTWCWLVNDQKYLLRNVLESFYERVIFDHEIGTIVDNDGNIFYRNKIVYPANHNKNLVKYIIEEMKNSKLHQIEIF